MGRRDGDVRVTITCKIIRTSGGISYYWNDVAEGGGTTDYYTAKGNPPGVWKGRGLAALGITAGGRSTRLEARRLYERLADPTDGRPLTALARRLARAGTGGDAKADAPAAPEQAATAGDGAETREADMTATPRRAHVNSYDLTFTMPKSVSILWATGDETTRRAIMACHFEAVDRTIGWLEDNVAAVRRGKGGAIQEKPLGLVAQRYDHWESRDGDPHLHSHLLVANLAPCADGQWRALDGRPLLANVVAASERHQNILLDLLHDRLGYTFVPRDGANRSGSRMATLDVAGVPAELIDAFSSRHIAIATEQERIERAMAARLGRPLTAREKAQANQDAWQRTRKPKARQAASLDDLTARWRTTLTQHLHTDPAALAAATQGTPTPPLPADVLAARPGFTGPMGRILTDLTGHRQDTRGKDGHPAPAPTEADPSGLDREADPTGHIATILRDARIDPRDPDMDGAETTDTPGRDDAWRVETTADRILRHTSSTHPIFRRANLTAEAERLTRLIRCGGNRDTLTSILVDRALATPDGKGGTEAIRLDPPRYRLPAWARGMDGIDDGTGHAGADQTRTATWTTRRLWDDEAGLMALAGHTDPAKAHGQDTVDRLLDHIDATSGRPLAADQRAAVRDILTSGRLMEGIVGPAGSGKTTTMRALRQAIDELDGAGKVTGLALSAQAAHVLSDSLGIPANTIARLESETANRTTARRVADLERILATTGDPARRAAIARDLAAARADLEGLAIPEGGTVIVDEASMAGTRHLAFVAAQCQARGARLVLVGDPCQLDSPADGGGMLGWMMRTGRTRDLTRLFRFTDPAEAAASLSLRAGTPAATGMYERMGRIHGGEGDDTFDEVYRRAIAHWEAGDSHLLIVSTNATLDELNRRISIELQARGLVDAETRTPLMDGNDAGAGDQVCLRRNDYRMRDSAGDNARNGQVWTIGHVGADTIRLTRALDDGTTVHMDAPRAWMAEHAQLGYAVTAHRCQGATVDTADLWVPTDAGIPRELLYVAMTRGRRRNDCHIQIDDMERMRATPAIAEWKDRRRAELEARGLREWTGDGPCPDTGAWYGPEDLEPGIQTLALARFAGMVANSQAPLTAHEEADRIHHERHSWARLTAEHDQHAATAAEPILHAIHEHAHGHAAHQRLVEADGWDALATTWATAHAIDPAAAEAIAADPTPTPAARPAPDGTGRLLDMPPDPDPAWQLRRRLIDQVITPARGTKALIGGAIAPTPIPDGHGRDAAAGQLAHQGEDMLRDKLATLADRLTGTGRPGWTWRMPPPPAQDTPAWDDWRDLLTAIAVYRRTWDETSQPTPLGPANGNPEHDTWRANLLARIAEHRDTTPWPGDARPMPTPTPEGPTPAMTATPGPEPATGPDRRHASIE